MTISDKRTVNEAQKRRSESCRHLEKGPEAQEQELEHLRCLLDVQWRVGSRGEGRGVQLRVSAAFNALGRVEIRKEGGKAGALFQHLAQQ